MAPERPPKGFARIASIAATGLRVGAGQLLGRLGVPGATEAAALAAARRLARLRGIALKAGQIGSYLEGVLPERDAAVYQKALAVLRNAAPVLDPAGAARVVEEELGAPPDRFFLDWEPKAFAAASIGEVHRARLPDVGEVAVKVQYEGIADALATELSLSTLATLLGPVSAKFRLDEQVEEIRARFLEELDYRHEAGAQAEFSALFHGDLHVRVPEVVPRASTTRVLTSRLVSGLSFEEAERAPEETRRFWAETLWRFVFKSLMHGLFNADPHPGNYLLGADHVWFLDFGCTRRLSPERTEMIREAHRASAAGDDARFIEAGAELVGLSSAGEGAQRGRDYLRLCFAPLFANGRYRITREYCRRLFTDMRDHTRAMVFGPAGEFTPLPADLLFLNRLQLGFYSVLARLDVDVDYHSLDAEIVSDLRAIA